MKTKKTFFVAVFLAAALTAGQAPAFPLFDDGTPGNGNGATFDTTKTVTDNGFLLTFFHVTPSGNEKTTTLTYGTTADGQNVLLEMQKLFTNHNGNTVDINQVFNVLPEPAPAPVTQVQVTATAGTAQ